MGGGVIKLGGVPSHQSSAALLVPYTTAIAVSRYFAKLGSIRKSKLPRIHVQGRRGYGFRRLARTSRRQFHARLPSSEEPR